jgi:16S rRNA (cytidine1402-2'-O)-methyltransferase
MCTLYVVATPIGNLSDLSARALEVLQRVDLIAAEDTRHTIKLLNHFEIQTPLVSYHKFNETEKGEYLIRKMQEEGIDIAVVSDAGTPGISDPGSKVVGLARRAGIKVVPIPGASSVVTALSVSGFDATEFVFLGFYPRENKQREQVREKIENSGFNCFVLFESPNRIGDTLGELNSMFPYACAAAFNDITKLHEKCYYGEIGAVCEELSQNSNSGKGEYTIVLYIPPEKKPQFCENADDRLSPEAALVDLIVKEQLTLKTAVKRLSETKRELSKNEIYQASLRLKKLFE